MELSLIRCIPFGGMLLSIAIFPTVSPKVWAKMEPFAVAFWIILLVIPNVIKYGAALTATRIGEIMITDYIPFIILLFGLYCVTGNIAMESDLGGTPKENLLLLLIGALLSSWIGTTGASIVSHQTCIENQQLAKAKDPHHRFLYFSGFKYRRYPNAGRRSSATHGFYARHSIFLEFEYAPYAFTQCRSITGHVLFHRKKIIRKRCPRGPAQ